jgi:hypothetical protein
MDCSTSTSDEIRRTTGLLMLFEPEAKYANEVVLWKLKSPVNELQGFS